MKIEDVQALLEKAKQATPGPWENAYDHVFKNRKDKNGPVICDVKECIDSDENAEYIAAANPQAIQTLAQNYLDALELLKMTTMHCVCTRNVKGFDYGEKHPILGKPRAGARWTVPNDFISDFLKKVGAND